MKTIFFSKQFVIKLLNFNICTLSILGIFRTVHYPYLPDDCNNVKLEVVNSVAIIPLSFST